MQSSIIAALQTFSAQITTMYNEEDDDKDQGESTMSSQPLVELLQSQQPMFIIPVIDNTVMFRGRCNKVF